MTLSEFMKDMENPGGVLHTAKQASKELKNQKKAEAERVERSKNDELLAERANERLKLTEMFVKVSTLKLLVRPIERGLSSLRR